MSSRRERIDAQQHDTGDPDDTVWVTGYQASHYHSNPECQQLTGSSADESCREDAQHRWLAPCGKCVLASEVRQR